MEGFSFVTPVTGQYRPNTGKEDDDDDDDSFTYLGTEVNYKNIKNITYQLTGISMGIENV
jgi:hypothetical protein